ncbi:MAG: HTH domain-containing protein [Lachnospiraceae bacterium]|nr:HTH domain-containing protein [Lachnospiraceae bacterium]
MSKREPKAYRQKRIYEIVRERGHVTCSCLASELHVTERTIRSDIEELSCEYPIETVSGNGGGIRLQEGFTLLKLAHSPKEIAVLNKYKQFADCPEDLAIFESMIRKCIF